MFGSRLVLVYYFNWHVPDGTSSFTLAGCIGKLFLESDESVISGFDLECVVEV